MKKLILTTLTAIGLAQGGRAANLIWTPASVTWDTSAPNWSNSNTHVTGVAYAAGDDVRFDDTGLAFPGVSLSGALTPGSVLVDSTGIYTLSGGTLAGSVPLTKKGSGLLVLGSNNTISSPTDIQGGQLQIGNGGSTGATGTGPITNTTGLIINRTGTLNLNNILTGNGGFTNLSSSTVNILGVNNMGGPILVQVGQLVLSNTVGQGQSTSITLDASAGSGSNARLGLEGGVNLSSGATINMIGTIASPLSRATISSPLATDTADNIVNGPIRVGSGGGLVQFNAGPTVAGELKINGNISDLDSSNPFTGQLYARGNGTGTISGTISFASPLVKFIRTDGGTFTLASSGNYWGGGTLVAVGGLRLGADNALPTGITFSIGQGSGATPILDLNGHSQQLPGVTSVHVSNPNVPIIGSSSTTADSTLVITAPAGVYGGALQDSVNGGTRKVGLTILSGAQQLTGVCTYSGPTTIMGGSVSLTGSGSIPNTTPITINSGAAIDVSAGSGTFTLGAAQTLKGNNTFNINGNLTSAGTIELKVSKSSGIIANDLMAVAGQMTYGGKLKLVLSGEALTAGDGFQVFSASTYAPSSFSTIEPAAPAPGYLWDLTNLSSYGVLQVVGPLIGTAVVSGTDIVFSGSGGVPNGSFAIVGSTSLATPIGSWGTVQTGTFDGSGNFSISIPITPGTPQEFFRMRVP